MQKKYILLLFFPVMDFEYPGWNSTSVKKSLWTVQKLIDSRLAGFQNDVRNRQSTELSTA